MFQSSVRWISAFMECYFKSPNQTMLEHPVIKKPRVIIEQNCETSRCFVLWFGFSEQRESSSSLPEGWGEEEEGKLPFCKSIPRVLPGCPESSKGAFANYNFAAAAGRSSTLRKARASGAHHAEPGGRCTIKRKRSLYRTMNSTVQKNIYYTHMRLLVVYWDHHQGQISLSTFSNVSSSSWCAIMIGV